MTHQPIRVVIADDHPIVRNGLRNSLEETPLIRLVGIAATFTEVFQVLQTTPTDVLVLDLAGMGEGPIKFAERLRREYPHVAVVVFSSSRDLAPELIKVGTLGYVIKEALPEQLITAIQAAHAGQSFVSPGVEEYLLRINEGRQEYQLAPQELHTLKLLSQGLGTMEIAAHMGIDPRSVRNYLTVLRRKTGCTERTQLVDPPDNRASGVSSSTIRHGLVPERYSW